MTTELTPQGLSADTFAEIRARLTDEFRAIYGPINIGPESAIGQQISIMAEAEAQIVQAAQAIYASQYPASAAGRSLDGVVQLTGITRREATRSVAQVTLTGEPGTTIPANSAAKTSAEDIFQLVEAVTLDGTGEGTGQMIAIEPGPVVAPAGTLTVIETPVAGWDEITNDDDATVGRPVESDPELRLRRAQSLQVTGSATVNAIRSRLLEQVEDVTNATIIENRADTVDAQGRPPHSFEAVVVGGTDADVAALLWEAKAAGIETTGQITEIVPDSQGKLQVIEFSRPIPQYVWAKITLDANGVGTYPSNAPALATDAFVAKGGELQLGDDVIYQSFVGPIFRAVDGLEGVTVEIAISTDPNTEPGSGDFASANLTVDNNEIALFDAARVEVTEV